jgi:translation initiation factor 3 subunit H
MKMVLKVQGTLELMAVLPKTCFFYYYYYLQSQENAARQAKDEPPLPEEDLNKLFRPIPVPQRLNPMIVSGQINTYSHHIAQFCSQSLAKLYITQALQAAKEGKSAP